MASRAPMSPGQARAISGGLLSAAVIAAAAGLIQHWEGTRLAPYRDIVGVWTVCSGDTSISMRHYSRAECDTILRMAVSGTYGHGVLGAVPGIERHPGSLVASISLAYNIGVPAYARSTVARRFRQGDWRGGCDAFKRWVHVGGKVLPGLVRRREAERALCLKGVG